MKLRQNCETEDRQVCCMQVRSGSDDKFEYYLENDALII